MPEIQPTKIAKNKEVSQQSDVAQQTEVEGVRADVATGPKMVNGPRMMNGPRMLNVPKVKKRTSDRLRKLKTKEIKGPGASVEEPLVLDESEEGLLTQEEGVVTSKDGIVLPYVRNMPCLVLHVF